MEFVGSAERIDAPTILELRTDNSVSGHARRLYIALDRWGHIVGIHTDAREAEALYGMRGAGIRAYVSLTLRVAPAEFPAWRRAVGNVATDPDALRFVRINGEPRR